MKNDVPHEKRHRWCFEKCPVFQDFQVQNGSRSSGWFGDVDGAIGKGQPQRQGADLPKGQRRIRVSTFWRGLKWYPHI